MRACEIEKHLIAVTLLAYALLACVFSLPEYPVMCYKEMLRRAGVASA